MAVELPAGDPTLELPFALAGPGLAGRLRGRPEDFRVDEILGYQASGDGEHDFLEILKRERNTHEVARILARHARVAQLAVGYAGLKDRNAVTRQHFTVQLPGRASPDWSAIEDEGLQVLSVRRHHRKIRRGALRGNRFRIRLTDLQGDRALVDRQLAEIARRGVPNYFGSQRFGRGGHNLPAAAAMFAGEGRRPRREQRGMLLSAVRAHLFNQVLAVRVRAGTWQSGVEGDVLLLEGTRRQFAFDAADTTIPQRLLELDIHPSGPLCGRASRALVPGGEAAAVERGALVDWAEWIEGLERFGLDADRRALRLAVRSLAWSWEADSLELSFELTSGAFATSVLREIVRSVEVPAA